MKADAQCLPGNIKICIFNFFWHKEADLTHFEIQMTIKSHWIWMNNAKPFFFSLEN